MQSTIVRYPSEGNRGETFAIKYRVKSYKKVMDTEQNGARLARVVSLRAEDRELELKILDGGLTREQLILFQSRREVIRWELDGKVRPVEENDSLGEKTETTETANRDEIDITVAERLADISNLDAYNLNARLSYLELAIENEVDDIRRRRQQVDSMVEAEERIPYISYITELETKLADLLREQRAIESLLEERMTPEDRVLTQINRTIEERAKLSVPKHAGSWEELLKGRVNFELGVLRYLESLDTTSGFTPETIDVIGKNIGISIESLRQARFELSEIQQLKDVNMELGIDIENRRLEEEAISGGLDTLPSDGRGPLRNVLAEILSYKGREVAQSISVPIRRIGAKLGSAAQTFVHHRDWLGGVPVLANSIKDLSIRVASEVRRRAKENTSKSIRGKMIASGEMDSDGLTFMQRRAGVLPRQVVYPTSGVTIDGSEWFVGEATSINADPLIVREKDEFGFAAVAAVVEERERDFITAEREKIVTSLQGQIDSLDPKKLEDAIRASKPYLDITGGENRPSLVAHFMREVKNYPSSEKARRILAGYRGSYLGINRHEDEGELLEAAE